MKVRHLLWSDALVHLGLAKSRSESKRLLKQGAVSITKDGRKYKVPYGTYAIYELIKGKEVI